MSSKKSCKVAFLIREPGACWPLEVAIGNGSPIISVRASLGNPLEVMRQAQQLLRASVARRIDCVLISLADAPPELSARRHAVMRVLGELLLELGCKRLVLIARNVKEFDLDELASLATAVQLAARGPLLVDVCFSSAAAESGLSRQTVAAPPQASAN